MRFRVPFLLAALSFLFLPAGGAITPPQLEAAGSLAVLATFPNGVKAYTPISAGELYETRQEGDRSIVTIHDALTGEVLRKGVFTSQGVPAWTLALVENTAPPADERSGELSILAECETHNQALGGQYCARSNWDSLYPSQSWHQMDLLKIYRGKYHTYAQWGSGFANYQQMGWVEITSTTENRDYWYSWCKAYTVSGSLTIRTRVWYEGHGNAYSNQDTLSASTTC